MSTFGKRGSLFQRQPSSPLAQGEPGRHRKLIKIKELRRLAEHVSARQGSQGCGQLH